MTVQYLISDELNLSKCDQTWSVFYSLCRRHLKFDLDPSKLVTM